MRYSIIPSIRSHSSFHNKYNVSSLSARSSDTSLDLFNVSQAVFACLSVIIGLLALIIGVLQLRRYRRRPILQSQDPVFELEACYPKVRYCILADTPTPDMQIDTVVSWCLHFKIEMLEVE
jgi:hypothetical protein